MKNFKLMFACSLLLAAATSNAYGSGTIPTRTVLKDYGWSSAERKIKVSSENTRSLDNGYPCSNFYLTFEFASAAEERVVSSSVFYDPNRCELFNEFLATASDHGGVLQFKQNAHLEKIRIQNEDEVSVYMSCTYFLTAHLPSGKKVHFSGSNLKMCESIKR